MIGRAALAVNGSITRVSIGRVWTRAHTLRQDPMQRTGRSPAMRYSPELSSHVIILVVRHQDKLFTRAERILRASLEPARVFGHVSKDSATPVETSAAKARPL
jgi:hypothetical protein